MTPSDDLQRLVERIEAATGDEPELFWEAFAAVHGPKPERVHGGSKELDDYLAKSNPFFYMLKARAFLNAAMTLVPDDWTAWELRSHSARTRFSADLSRLTECDATDEDWAVGRGTTPANAIAAAALRARITQEQSNDRSSNG